MSRFGARGNGRVLARLTARASRLVPALAAIAVLAPVVDARAASDLSVSATRSVASIPVGERFVFTFSLSNGGPDASATTSLDVRGVPVADAVLAVPDQGTCRAGRRMRCDLGALAPGHAVSVRLYVRPVAPGRVTAHAIASGADADPHPANDAATVRARVTLRPGGCANTLGGGAGPDLFPGTRGGDRLVGRGGDDRLFGGPGKDCLFGMRGRDRLAGGSGDDRISGGGGRDELYGASGDDSLSGGPGGDLIFAGPGDDVIRSNADDPGTDLVDCGGGYDVAYLTPATLARGCEQVTVIPRGCHHRGSRVICPPAPTPAPTPAPNGPPPQSDGGGVGGGGGGGGGGHRGRRRRHCRHRHGRRYCPIGGVGQKRIGTTPASSPSRR